MSEVKEWLLTLPAISKSQVEEDADLTEDKEWEDVEFDFLIPFIEKYKIEMPDHGYWYHAEEPKGAFDYVIHKGPHELAEHIPIRPSTLEASVAAGKWVIEYPSREMPDGYILREPLDILKGFSGRIIFIFLIPILLAYTVGYSIYKKVKFLLKKNPYTSHN